MNAECCGKISGSYLQYFLRFELFSPIFGQVQTDRQKATHMSPPCNLSIPQFSYLHLKHPNILHTLDEHFRSIIRGILVMISCQEKMDPEQSF